MSDQKKISLKDLIREAGRQLRQDFDEIWSSNPHAGESGGEAEDILKQFLKQRLPRRFDIETGFIVGNDGTVSRQTDLIIFDALNSPVYRKGSRSHILPRDNVAAVIEVKSKLNKDELKDAAKKISSVKQIKPTPISTSDQPVTFSDFIMTHTLGCVFAFDSYTSLETLAENLREINSEYESDNWIDLVVVLDKGLIGYTAQVPFGGKFMRWGGTTEEQFVIPPYYIHLVCEESGDLALNQFFVRLMAHLSYFRKISAIDFEAVLGPGPFQSMTLQGYQYNLSRKLVPAEESHQEDKFENPKIRFNLYSKKDRYYLGQVSLLPWQDGAVIIYSGRIDPRIIFQHYAKSLKLDGIFVPAAVENMWLSSILPIGEGDFIRLSQPIHEDFISIRDSDDNEPPPRRI